MGPPVQVRLLGPFEVSTDVRAAGPWARPSARRLCQRVLIAPGRRISRDLACDDLFPDLDPRSAARAVSKALSMARAALAGTAPGLLADEPYADWALRPRERLAELRQECRLTLARDRAKGAGQSSAKAVTEAWEDCFEHDPACEEAAAALIRGYAGDGRRELAVRVHERCAAALGELGLRIPASLAEPLAAPPVHAPGQVREEVRTVTILSAEVAAPPELGLEGMRDALAASLTAVVAEAEALGGTLMSLSGSGHAFANTEAIASYRGALALLDSGTEAARLNAKLANVLWRTARRAEARDAFAAGLRQVDEADVVFRAHLLTRLGRLEMVENRGAVAMRAFDDAEALLAPLIAALLAGDVAAADDETAEQWLELMVDGRADLLAISGQEDLALATLRAVQPVLEVRGSPARKCSFYHVRATARILRNRYRVDEADIEDLKLAAAAAAGSEEKDLAYAMFFVGWGLLLHDDLTAARDYLEQSLTLAERIGEAVLVGECLVNLGITAVRRHDTEAVGSLVDRAQAAAIPTSGFGLPAEASACLVWLAWQDGRPAEVIALAAPDRCRRPHQLPRPRWPLPARLGLPAAPDRHPPGRRQRRGRGGSRPPAA